MVKSQEIAKAIAAHGIWKQRLGAAIRYGASGTTPERVEPDNLCELGKWLYSLSPAERCSEHFKRVHALHAAFHKEAASILRLALSGKKTDAEMAMAEGTSFAQISADLTAAMMAWSTGHDD